MLTSALSAYFINSENISLKEYKNAINSQPKHRIKKNIHNNLILSENNKNKINDDLLYLINVNKDFIATHKKAFKYNFDRWIIEEAGDILVAVELIINNHEKLNIGYKQWKKNFKKYPSLTSKLDELISINNEIIDFTKKYLTRAKKADEAYKFINNFIPKNQEVLKALA